MTFNFGKQTYSPGNFGQQFYGPVTLKFAMAHLVECGDCERGGDHRVSERVESGADCGIEQGNAADACRGVGRVRSDTSRNGGAYTVFANDGTYVKPTFIKQVRSPNTVVLDGTPERHRALDPRIAFLMRDMLQEVMRSGTAASVWSFGFKGAAAGKTGTSRDGWFAGFTPNLVVYHLGRLRRQPRARPRRFQVSPADLGGVYEARGGNLSGPGHFLEGAGWDCPR